MQQTTRLGGHCLRIGGIAVLIFGLLAGCASQRTKDNTLFTDLGGRDGLHKLIDDFLYNLADDKRINHYFAGMDALRFRRKLYEQFCTLSNGPCTYTGDSMRRIHAGLHIDDADFNDLVADLIDAMDKRKISISARNRLLAKLAPMYGEIVEN